MRSSPERPTLLSGQAIHRSIRTSEPFVQAATKPGDGSSLSLPKLFLGRFKPDGKRRKTRTGRRRDGILLCPEWSRVAEPLLEYGRGTSLVRSHDLP